MLCGSWALESWWEVAASSLSLWSWRSKVNNNNNNNNNSSLLWRHMQSVRGASVLRPTLFWRGESLTGTWRVRASVETWWWGEGRSRRQARHRWSFDWLWTICELVGEGELRRMNEGGWEYGGGEWVGWDREGWMWLECDKWLKRFWRWCEGV